MMELSDGRKSSKIGLAVLIQYRRMTDTQPHSQPRRRSIYRAYYFERVKQEAHQLMLTNLRDAFIGQSRSPNIVPFHMLGIVSYCAIVTLFSRCAVFTILDLKKCYDLEIGVRGHTRSLKVAPFDRLRTVSYLCSLEILSLKRTIFEIFVFSNTMTFLSGSKVTIR